MAKKFDDELLKDARKENNDYVRKNGVNHNKAFQKLDEGKTDSKIDPENNATGAGEGRGDQNTQNANPDEKTDQNSQGENKQDQTSQNQNSQSSSYQNHQQPNQDDELEKKFNEFFSKNPLIAGQTAVNLVDDLKANFFMIYAKKNGVEMPKEAFQMDPKSKEFVAFLVDYALKNKLFDWIKKYPIVAAIGVFGISAGSTWMMVEMLKKNNAESEKKDKQIKDLEAKLKKKRREEAEEVEEEEEEDPEEEEEEEEEEDPKSSTDMKDVKDFIAKT